MIMTGLLPAQVRSRPIVRGGKTYNNARVNNTTIQFTKADIPARVGDMVFFDYYAEFGGSTPTIINSNFGFMPLPYSGGPGDRGLSGYKLWDGTEPDTMQITCPGAGIAIAPYSIYVVTGVTKLAGTLHEDTSNRSVAALAVPSRIWFISSTTSSGETTIATPPAGYTGYQQATTTASDNGGIRAAYRIEDRASALTGSWSSAPTQTGRRTTGFR